MTPNPKRVVPTFRGFILFETDEPLFAALQPDHQNVLRLTGSYAEMVEQLHVPPGTLRSRLNRARAALVALRQKQSGPEGLP
jgi:DNA-directed RNA polymerase specialized sigma24 family protein